MQGYVANTDFNWYQMLRDRGPWDEDLIHLGPPNLEPDPAPGDALLPESLVPA